ncbi:Flp pilus assembly protein CpaB [Nocardioides sp. CER19]|uniref:Flp pilus assembly protein CpaB n=1 Tax=Nocardioides sp. CER19 TaxID=3038538 RepID=UPI00244D0038|nr:Flp pilus assembly protein CpaB [Nocardioides sp. CER19]MDH2416751.1 Flp pilus assembly protein CpaB [Nocardioides sp. CER19]
MERRRILVVAAALVAALGAVLVFMYVRGADTRAQDQFQTTDVLVATQPIQTGETIEAASSAGKITKKAVANNSLLPEYQVDLSALAGKVALTTIYPGEQIISSKFGTTAAPATLLQIPDNQIAISVNLTDTARVAGFVNPGSQVAIFLNGTDPKSGKTFTQLLLPKVTVIGVGSTTPVSTTTTSQSGAQTTEQLPRTLLTLAVTQDEGQKIMFSQGNGELAFGLLPTDGKATVKPGIRTDYDNLFG